MTYQQHSYKLFGLIAAAIIILFGCAPKMQKPLKICQGRESLNESLNSLKLRSGNMVPFEANGQCLAKFYTESESKPDKENFPVKLWVNPPAQIRLHGDIALNASGLDLGSNDSEFWLSIRPKEISTYWWGNWADQNDLSRRLMINPEVVLEAFGNLETGNQESWSLSNEGPFDVLTKRNQQNTIIKKVYIYCCDYLIRKIEYFEKNGKAEAVTKLDNYKQIAKDFFVPTVIEIIHSNQDDTEDSLKITLQSTKSTSFTEKKRNVLFTRPQPKSFEHVLKIINGKIVEQPE
jgi:hypothetical protein